METNELSFDEQCKKRRARATLEDDDADVNEPEKVVEFIEPEKMEEEVKEEEEVEKEVVVEEVEKKAEADVLFDQATNFSHAEEAGKEVMEAYAKFPRAPAPLEVTKETIHCSSTAPAPYSHPRTDTLPAQA